MSCSRCWPRASGMRCQVSGWHTAPPRRQKQIRNGLPDALDLLIVCIEAGSALDQAIVKAAEELALPYPALAEELRLINTETRAGKPRLEAFKNFAARTAVDDVRSLVAMLVQTDRFGTSIAQALRTHANVSRTKRRQRAEERAAKLGVKLVFPLVFFLFPAMYVVVLGPAIIKIVHFLLEKLHRGLDWRQDSWTQRRSCFAHRRRRTGAVPAAAEIAPVARRLVHRLAP